MLAAATLTLLGAAVLPGSVRARSRDEPQNLTPSVAGGKIVGTNDFFSVELNAMTGEATAVSGLMLGGFQYVRGLSFDRNTNTLYGTDGIGGTRQLITIDPATGEGTAVGPVGFEAVEALAFDANTNTLYGTDGGYEGTDQLITIDPATGWGTAVGALGFGGVEGLAFDPNSNTLYGSTEYSLLTIDPATGASTFVGYFAVLSQVSGLAFDAKTNTLYGVGPLDGLFSINPDTGAATVISPFNTLGGTYGLA